MSASFNRSKSLSRFFIVLFIQFFVGGIVLGLLSAGHLLAAPAAVVSWQDPVSGDWDDASNWDTGNVPDSNDDVMITLSGDYTITINSVETVNSLTLGDGFSGRQALLIRGGGNLKYALESIVRQTGVLVIGGGDLVNVGGLNNEGEVSLYSGDISGVGIFTNSSRIAKHRSGIATISGSFFNSSFGDIDVQGGTLSVTGPSLSNGGHVYVATGAELVINSNSFNLAGNHSGQIDGAMRQDGGIFFVQHPGAHFYFTNNGFSWNGGVISGTAPLTTTGRFEISGFSHKQLSTVLVNQGQMDVIGNGDLQLLKSGGILLNDTSGVLEVHTGLNISDNGSLFEPPRLDNRGLLVKSGGGIMTMWTNFYNGYIIGRGDVEVQSGMLLLQGGGLSYGGVFTVATGANIFIGSPGFSVALDHSGQIDGGFQLQGGELLVEPPGARFNFSNNGFGWEGGTISGTVPLTTTGQFSITGPTLKQLSTVLVNQGQIDVIGNGDLQLLKSGGILLNDTSGVLEVHTGLNISDNGSSFEPPRLDNRGLLVKSGGGIMTMWTNFYNGYITGRGDVEVQSGMLLLQGGGLSYGGVFTVATGANIFIGSPGFSMALDHSGQIDGGFQLQGGELLVEPPGARFNFSNNGFGWEGGTISGTVPLTTTGQFSITGPTLKQLSTVLVNQGQMDVIGNGDLQLLKSGGILLNDTSGVLEVHTGLNISDNGSLFEPPRLDNRGLLVKSGGGIMTMWTNFYNGYITGRGDVEVQSGMLLLQGGGLSYGGVFTVATGANIFIGSPGFSMALDHSGQIDGGFQLQGGELLVEPPGARFNFSNNGFGWEGGTISGTATLSNTGVMNVTGSSIKSLHAAFANAGSFYVNTGTVQVMKALTGTAGLLHVGPGATLDLMGTTHYFDGLLTLDGLGDVDFSDGTTLLDGLYDVSGTTTVSGGTTDFDNAAGISFGDLVLGSGRLDIDNNASISGHFTRGSGIFNFNPGTGTFTFNGGGTQNLTLNSNLSFYNLTVAAGTTLEETVAADNATVNGTLTNLGIIRKSQPVVGTGSRSFGLTGVQIDVVAQGTLSNIQVDRVDSNHANATAGIMTGRYWDITPTGGGYNATLTLPHSNLSGPKACRYTGSGQVWDCAVTISTTTTLTRDNITSFSPWAVGNNVGPTAVKLQSLGAHSSIGNLGLLLINLVFISLTIIIISRRDEHVEPKT